MKSSEALKKARCRISCGRNIYVCTAVADSGGRETAVYRNLKALFGYSSIFDWLTDNSKAFRRYARTGRRLDAAMRDYRLRWIDWMIPQYEAIGD